MTKRIVSIILTLLLVFNGIPLNITFRGRSVNLGIKQAQATGESWLSGYTYRKKITLTGQSGAGTGYQVKLLVGESSGATGENFDVESHSANFPNDITFTDDDGATELKYWLESTTGTTPNRLSTFWVKVTDSLETNQDIYVYYGKSSDNTDDSDGTNTFLFFDDFSGDLTKWTTSYGIPTIATGVLQLDGATSADVEAVIGNTLCPINSAFRIRSKNSVDTMYNLQGLADAANDAEAFPDAALMYRHGVFPNLSPRSWTFNEGAETEKNHTGLYGDAYHIFEGLWVSGSATFLLDGAVTNTHTSNVPDESMYVFLRHGYNGGAGTGGTFSTDWVLCRKYASPEPSASAGSEEGRSLRLQGIKVEGIRFN